nr:MAG TPA: DNA pilot protein VP2 [Microviridae sp.]
MGFGQQFLGSFSNFGSKLGSAVGGTGLSAIASGASGLMDFAFGGLKARRQWKYQQKQMALQHQYNLDEMWYEQQYNEANMAKQFEYQQKAWQAENEYNDPSAVAARYRAAGVSPQAALGGAASGAGLAMSMDTPSSSNPSAHGVSGGGDYSGGSTNLTALANISSQAALADFYKAQADKVRSETFDNDFNKSIAETRKSLDESVTSLNNQKRLTESQNTRIAGLAADLAAATLDKNIEIVNAKATKMYAEIASIELANEHQKFENDNQREEFETNMANLRASTYKMQMEAMLAADQAEYTRVSAKKVDQEIEKLFQDTKIAQYTKERIYAELDAELPYLDEKAKNGAALLAAQAFATDFNARTERKRVTNEIVQGSIRSAVSVAGVVMSRGVSAATSSPSLYGSDGRVIGEGGRLVKPY